MSYPPIGETNHHRLKNKKPPPPQIAPEMREHDGDSYIWHIRVSRILSAATERATDALSIISPS
jgi:hypothetical protein